MAWRRFVEKHTPHTPECTFDASGSTPLFDVRLHVVLEDGVEPCVSIVPGLPEIEHALVQILDDMIAAAKVRILYCNDRHKNEFSYR